MRWLETLHPCAAAPVLLSYSRTHWGPPDNKFDQPWFSHTYCCHNEISIRFDNFIFRISRFIHPPQNLLSFLFLLFYIASVKLWPAGQVWATVSLNLARKANISVTTRATAHVLPVFSLKNIIVTSLVHLFQSIWSCMCAIWDYLYYSIFYNSSRFSLFVVHVNDSLQYLKEDSFSNKHQHWCATLSKF